MKLITKELEKLFEKYPIGSQDGLAGKAKVIAKFFNPTGVGTWIITEGNKLEMVIMKCLDIVILGMLKWLNLDM